ncbi:Protein FAR1-RELATED SEQUENCE 2 [Platanthera zijinensis]|uniref:Protein FAR1-RELATED SEQUENCE n=1 Tax=Platanthera zijinensis TaxID=2320716 RepID=A0AAP0FZC7_9ASPA
MITTYSLEENIWLEELWKVREKWSAFHRASSFCANMTTTQRSESMNNQFKRHFGRKLTFLKFIEEFELAVNKFREKELYEDHKSKNFTPNVRVPSMPMLMDAVKEYTRTIYADFEEECLSQISCICELVTSNEDSHFYRVSPPEEFKVTYVTYNVSDYSLECSCRKFETFGILCMHGMKVLTHNKVLMLPSRYIQKKWSKFSKDGLPYQTQNYNYEDVSLQYGRVSRNALALAMKCSSSKQALDMLERGIEQMSVQANDIMQANYIADMGMSVNSSKIGTAEHCVQIKPPPIKSGGQRRRIKSVLERATKRRSYKNNRNSTSSSAVIEQDIHGVETQPEPVLHQMGFMGLLNQVSFGSQDVSRRQNF